MSASLHIRDWCVKTDDQTLIEGAHVRFGAGRVWGVVGRSGAGKSVLLKSAVGLMPAHSGQVELQLSGHAIRVQPGETAAFALLRQHVVFVHQDPALLDDVTVEQNVSFAISRLGRDSPAQKREKVAYWLERLGLWDIAKRLPTEITPGQQRKVALCRALTLSPEILIADEATTGLDPLASAEIIASLRSVSQEGTTLILVSHDIRCLRALAKDLVWVDQGRIKFQGNLPEHRSELPPGLVPLLFGARPHLPAPVEA